VKNKGKKIIQFTFAFVCGFVIAYLSDTRPGGAIDIDLGTCSL